MRRQRSEKKIAIGASVAFCTLFSCRGKRESASGQNVQTKLGEQSWECSTFCAKKMKGFASGIDKRKTKSMLFRYLTRQSFHSVVSKKNTAMIGDGRHKTIDTIYREFGISIYRISELKLSIWYLLITLEGVSRGGGGGVIPATTVCHSRRSSKIKISGELSIKRKQ